MNAEQGTKIDYAALPPALGTPARSALPARASAPAVGDLALGPFLLDAAARILLHDGAPLTLGERAVSVLMCLARQAGRLVTKDELLTSVWQGLAVEESNLTVQIAALRRVLAGTPGGEGWIETLPRRGYRYVGPLAQPLPATLPAPRPAMAAADPHPAVIPTVAVLPFRAIDVDPVPGYFANGLVEEIVSMLAGLRELTVLSRGSTLKFRDREIDPGEAGRELGARYIVSGAVRRSAGQMRVIAELTEVETGAVLWSRSYNAAESLLFDAQDHIVARIVDTAAPRVREAELRRVRSRRPDDMDAYHLVLRARELLYRLERNSFETAGALLLRAIALDPDYPSAHVLAAEWHTLRIGQGWSPDPAADVRAADSYAIAAILRDGANARALALHGHSRSFLLRDYDTALLLFDQALEAAPNDAVAWGWSSPTHSFIGDGAAAIARAEKALKLSPSDPLGFRYQHFLCLGHYAAGNLEEAVHWGTRAARAQPRYTANLRYTAAALAGLGRVAQAREIGRRVLAEEPDFRVGPLIARHPFRDPARRARIGEQLLAAGLPA